MRHIKIITVLLSGILLLSGCSKKQEKSSSMEQIYAQEGVPVKTVTVTPRLFTKQLLYNAPLSGVQESSVYASFGGEIEKIYVKVGDYVKKDDILMSFPTDNPSANYYQAKVAFENAEKAYHRMENLYASGGISKQERDNIKTQYEVAKANWNTVQQTVYVKAPISGYVTKINVHETDNVKREGELATISRTERLKCKIWASDEEILLLKKGQNASAVWNDRKIEGKVVQVNLSMNRMKQAFGVTLEFDNKEQAIPAGVTAKIAVNVYENPEAFIVKRKDVMTDGSSFFLYVAENGKARKRQVVPGHSNGLDMEIVSGLKGGELLITEGQMLLKDGIKIRITD